MKSRHHQRADVCTLPAALRLPARPVCTASEIAALISKAFHPLRDARSFQYIQGARDVLNLKLGKIPMPAPPFAPGWPEADAYSAGCTEGHDIVRVTIAAWVSA